MAHGKNSAIGMKEFHEERARKKEIKMAKKAEEQQSWDELETIYQSAAQMIYEVGVNIRDAVQGVEKIVDTGKQKELRVTINGLVSDLNKFTDDLTFIYDKHKGRAGLIESDDEYLASLSIFEDYMNFNLRFKAVVLPTVLFITEITAEASMAQPAETIEQNETVQELH